MSIVIQNEYEAHFFEPLLNHISQFFFKEIDMSQFYNDIELVGYLSVNAVHTYIGYKHVAATCLMLYHISPSDSYSGLSLIGHRANIVTTVLGP